MIPTTFRAWHPAKFMGLLIVASVSGVTGFAQIPERSIKVTRVGSNDLSMAEVNRIMLDVSAIFTQADITPSCPVDIACPFILRLQRLDSVPGPRFILQPQELINLRRSSGSDVLVVDDIGDAACPGGIRGPGRILGCEGPANDWMAVLRYPPMATQGIVWAHEYSHLRGNTDRNKVERCALMSPAYDDANRTLDLPECTVIRGTPPPPTSSAPPSTPRTKTSVPKAKEK
jgi:hypothetical protein